MGWFFSKKAEKRDLDILKEAVQTSFKQSKEDIGNLSKWVKHLDREDSALKDDILELKEDLSTVREELENLKNIVSIVGNKGVFKQRQTVFNKQTAVEGVLNSVQTGVQTVFLDNLSTTERAIVFVLLNSDMKLSYEDVGSILGKSKATIRGQINAIRKKSEGLIEEVTSENNKKRVYIPEKMREILLKSGKVRVKRKKNDEKY